MYKALINKVLKAPESLGRRRYVRQQNNMQHEIDGIEFVLELPKNEAEVSSCRRCIEITMLIE